MKNIERQRIEGAGRLITITSRYDSKKKLWRASAPNFQRIGGDTSVETTNREQVINITGERLRVGLSMAKRSEPAYRTSLTSQERRANAGHCLLMTPFPVTREFLLPYLAGL